MGKGKPEAVLLFKLFLTLPGPDTGLGITFLCGHTVDFEPHLPGLSKNILRTCNLRSWDDLIPASQTRKLSLREGQRVPWVHVIEVGRKSQWNPDSPSCCLSQTPVWHPTIYVHFPFCPSSLNAIR